MFYQYLRGRRYELLAIRATAPVIAASQRVIPVIEPVGKNLADLKRAGLTLFGAGARLAIITNPLVPEGNWNGTQDIIADSNFPDEVRDHTNLIPARIISAGPNDPTVRRFLKQYQGRPVLLIHQDPCTDAQAVLTAANNHSAGVTHLFVERGTGRAYRGLFTGSIRGLLRDGFKRQTKNALYPTEDFFSDLYATYTSDGYQAFGDYSIIGDHFQEGGYSPRAVVIHLTYHKRVEKAIYCRHFLSDSNVTTSNPGGKFLEAVSKAARFLTKDPDGRQVARTDAAQELLDYHRRQHYPGLPKLKEVGMRHHIEIMAGLV